MNRSTSPIVMRRGSSNMPTPIQQKNLASIKEKVPAFTEGLIMPTGEAVPLSSVTGDTDTKSLCLLNKARIWSTEEDLQLAR